MLNKNYMHWEKIVQIEISIEKYTYKDQYKYLFCYYYIYYFNNYKLLYQYVLIKNFIQITDII